MLQLVAAKRTRLTYRLLSFFALFLILSLGTTVSTLGICRVLLASLIPWHMVKKKGLNVTKTHESPSQHF